LQDHGVPKQNEVALYWETAVAIKIEGLAPLLQVFDMSKSIEFYRDVLGFKVVNTSSTSDPERFWLGAATAWWCGTDAQYSLRR
jgi:hypothetical protein